MADIMITEQKASVFRKYFMEAIIYGLTLAIVTLFYLYANLNTFIREDFMRKNTEQMRVIEQNTATMQDLKQYFISSLKQNQK